MADQPVWNPSDKDADACWTDIGERRLRAMAVVVEAGSAEDVEAAILAAGLGAL